MPDRFGEDRKIVQNDRITHGKVFFMGDFFFTYWTHFTNHIENAQNDFTFLCICAIMHTSSVGYLVGVVNILTNKRLMWLGEGAI